MISVCSQKAVQLSSGRLFLEEIDGKFTSSLINSWENMPPGGPSFQCLAKSLITSDQLTDLFGVMSRPKA